MDQRPLDKLGAPVSLLGFGFMRLPLLDDGSKGIDYPLAERLVWRAVAGGVNYFDTAWPYHEGESERFAGRVLGALPRDSYYLADKLPTWDMKERGDLDRVFEQQLEKCKVDYFDFYLVHCLNVANYDIMLRLGLHDRLLELKEGGRIRRLGFSFHDTPGLMERIVNGHEWDFAQIQLNYIDWETLDAKRLYELVTAKGIPVIVMEPVRGGALATLTPEARKVLRKTRPGASAASWAIRYAASLPGVMTVLSGMNSMEQVEDNLRALSPLEPLGATERSALAEAAALYRASGAIPCTGCRYCMDCPSGVDIPAVFDLYNQYRATGYRLAFDNNYRSLDEGRRARSCVACGECMRHCPQGLEIPELLKQVATEAEGQA